MKQMKEARDLPETFFWKCIPAILDDQPLGPLVCSSSAVEEDNGEHMGTTIGDDATSGSYPAQRLVQQRMQQLQGWRRKTTREAQGQEIPWEVRVHDRLRDLQAFPVGPFEATFTDISRMHQYLMMGLKCQEMLVYVGIGEQPSAETFLQLPDNKALGKANSVPGKTGCQCNV